MKLTPASAIQYLKTYRLSNNESFRVVISKKTHDHLGAALDKLGHRTSWAKPALQDQALVDLFAEIMRADLAINLNTTFPETEGGENEYSICIFSRYLGVTACFPHPTPEMIKTFQERSPGLRRSRGSSPAGKAIANPLHGSNRASSAARPDVKSGTSKLSSKHFAGKGAR